MREKREAEYYYDLRHNNRLWMEVLNAFRNAILDLDFKEVWPEVDFE